MRLRIVFPIVAAAYISLAATAPSEESRAPSEPSYPESAESLDRISIRSFYSKALGKTVPFTSITPLGEPPEEGWATLFLLHGRGRDHGSLTDDTRSRHVLLQQPYLIVLPSGFDGWFINSPVNSLAKYGSALEELENIISCEHATRDERHQRAIAGWSMGGFGALYHATQRPKYYGFAAAIIGLVDFPRWKGLPNDQRYQVPEATFGSDQRVWRNFNPRLHLSALRDTVVFLAIGEQSFDRTMNENFLRDARKASIAITAIHLPHGHTFEAVQDALPIVLEAVRAHFER